MEFLATPPAHGGAAVQRIDTHAAAVFLAGDARAQDQARGAFSVPRLFHAGKAQSRLRGRDRGQPAVRADDLSRRGGDHPRADGGLAHRRRGRAGGMGGGDAALRRDADARSSGRARRDRRRGWPTRSAARWPRRMRGRRRADAGFVAELADVIAQNDAELRGDPDLFPAPAVAALTRATRTAFARLRPLLEARERAGLRRALPWRPAPRQHRAARRRARAVRRHRIRPAHRHRRRALRSRFPAHGPDQARPCAAATIVLNRYLNETRRVDDLDALAALPLFLSLRAAIRAKVTAARATPATRARRPSRAGATISRWHRRCWRRRHRVLVAVGGLSGTGKTQLARALAPELLPAPGAVLLQERRRAQGDVRHARERAFAADRLHARGHRARLCGHRREGAPRHRRRPFGDRGCGLCATRGTQRYRTRGRPRRIPRAFPHRRA